MIFYFEIVWIAVLQNVFQKNDSSKLTAKKGIFFLHFLKRYSNVLTSIYKL